MWVFSSVTQCVGVFYLASGFFLDGIDPHLADYSMCLWEEEKSRASYFHRVADVTLEVIASETIV